MLRRNLPSQAGVFRAISTALTKIRICHTNPVSCTDRHNVRPFSSCFFTRALIRASITTFPYRWFSSLNATKRDESFASFTSQIHQDIVALQNLVLADPNVQDLAELRQAAATSNFWDDATTAASVVQRMAAIESRNSRIDHLHSRFSDTKELYELAMEEKDEPMVQDCVDAMASIRALAQQLRLEMLLSHESDARSCFLEIQAGAGGTDSCDWTAMMARMYARWGESRGFQVQNVDEFPGEEAGYRSIVLRLNGSFAYGWAKSEAGVHRLVRISPFDSARRRHTSFAQVRVYPMTADSQPNDEIELLIKDLRIDTYRSSGPGGQHVNCTDSAVRITHMPSGIVVQNQSDRSQHRNKAEAMAVLRAKLYKRKLEKEAEVRQEHTKGLGENAWGNQIRSYVLHPYQLVKDHRTNYSESNTTNVLDGHIDNFIEKVLLQIANNSRKMNDKLSNA